MKAYAFLKNFTVALVATILLTNNAFASGIEERLLQYMTPEERKEAIAQHALANPPSPEELFQKEEELQQKRDYNNLFHECRAAGAEIANKALAIEANATARTAGAYEEVADAMSIALRANAQHAKKYAMDLDKPNPLLRSGVRQGFVVWDQAQANLHYTHEAMKRQGADWIRAEEQLNSYVVNTVKSVFTRQQLLDYGFYHEPLMLVKNFKKLKYQHKLMFCKEYAQQAYSN